MLELGLSWNGIPLDICLEPWRLAPSQRQQVKEAAEAVGRAVECATQWFVSDPQVRSRFGYGPLQERCVLASPGYAPWVPVGRLDAYLDGDRLKFLEFNTDGAAGWHWMSMIEALSAQSAGAAPPGESLATRLLDQLLDCFRRWNRQAERVPRIAIVDWREVSTRSEQVGLARTFRARGVPCTVEDPRDLRLVQGRLTGPDGPIDLVYRRLVSEEAFARAHEVEPFLQAYLLGAACFVGGFRTDPAWSKTMFSLLSDPALQQRLSPQDQRWVQSTVPWTVAVSNGTVLGDGPPSSTLRRRLLRQPECYIIKPARGYAGKGISAGAIADQDAWNGAVERLFAGGDWVVQEYCTPVLMKSPLPDGFRFVHLMVFMLGGKATDLAGRCSRTPILGSTTPEIWLPAS